MHQDWRIKFVRSYTLNCGWAGTAAVALPVEGRLTRHPPLSLTAASLTSGTIVTPVLDARLVSRVAGTLIALTPSTGVTAPVPARALLGVMRIAEIVPFLVVCRISSVHAFSRGRCAPSQWPQQRPLGLSRPLHFQRRSSCSFLICRLPLFPHLVPHQGSSSRITPTRVGLSSP